MKALWLETSARIGILFVALGVLLADANDRSYTVHAHRSSNAVD